MLIVLAAAYGLVFGSFANVVIYRLPRGLELAKTPSSCVSCGTKIKPLHIIPVFSWLFLRGRCAYCGAKVSPRYPAVELLIAVLFALMFWRHENVLQASLWCVFMLYLIIAAFIDFDTEMIPNSLNVAGLVAGLAYLALNLSDAFNLLLGAVVGGGILLAFDLLARLILKKPGFGGGDIKLMAVCGLFLGWYGALAALWLAVAAGGAFAVFLLLTKRAGRGSYFAFGPFLCAGAAVAGYFFV